MPQFIIERFADGRCATWACVAAIDVPAGQAAAAIQAAVGRMPDRHGHVCADPLGNGMVRVCEMRRQTTGLDVATAAQHAASQQAPIQPVPTGLPAPADGYPWINPAAPAPAAAPPAAAYPYATAPSPAPPASTALLPDHHPAAHAPYEPRDPRTRLIAFARSGWTERQAREQVNTWFGKALLRVGKASKRERITRSMLGEYWIFRAVPASHFDLTSERVLQPAATVFLAVANRRSSRKYGHLGPVARIPLPEAG